MPRRCPCCQKSIRGCHYLCNKCEEEYGTLFSAFPEWLKEIIKFDQATARSDRDFDRHNSLFCDMASCGDNL